MQGSTVDEAGYHIIAIEGELDASSAILLDKQLQKSIEEGRKKLLIDCRKLEYISSPGFGVFTSRIDFCEEKGIRIVFFGLSDTIEHVFKILGIDQVLPIRYSLAEAKKAADEAQHNDLS